MPRAGGYFAFAVKVRLASRRAPTDRHDKQLTRPGGTNQRALEIDDNGRDKGGDGAEISDVREILPS